MFGSYGLAHHCTSETRSAGRVPTLQPSCKIHDPVYPTCVRYVSLRFFWAVVAAASRKMQRGADRCTTHRGSHTRREHTRSTKRYSWYMRACPVPVSVCFAAYRQEDVTTLHVRLSKAKQEPPMPEKHLESGLSSNSLCCIHEAILGSTQ